jgi:hypothetical protein
MRAWCPRCDAVHPGATACPECATPLADLEDPAAADHQPDLAAARRRRPRRRRPAAADRPGRGHPGRGRAGLRGRPQRRPARPPGRPPPPPRPAPPSPRCRGPTGASWAGASAPGGLSVTAVEAGRLATEQRETVAELTFRIQGLPGDQGVLALRDCGCSTPAAACTPASSTARSAARAAPGRARRRRPRHLPGRHRAGAAPVVAGPDRTWPGWSPSGPPTRPSPWTPRGRGRPAPGCGPSTPAPATPSASASARSRGPTSSCG